MLNTLRFLLAPLALLVVAACASTASAPSMFGEWNVSAIEGTPVMEGSPAFLRFNDDGSVSGNAGVNRLQGSWTIEDDVFKIGPLAVTRMAGPEPLMDQETRLLAAIDKVCCFGVEEGDLVLSDMDGAEVVRAAPRPASE